MKFKSIPTALFLTFFLGPIGLAYVSISQAVIGVLILMFGAYFIDGFDPNALSGFVIVAWVSFMAVAGSMASNHNKEIEEARELEERRHQELLAAARATAKLESSEPSS